MAGGTSQRSKRFDTGGEPDRSQGARLAKVGTRTQLFVLKTDADGGIDVTPLEVLPEFDRTVYLLLDAGTVDQLAGSRVSLTPRTSLSALPGKIATAARAMAEMVRLAPAEDADHPFAARIGPAWTTPQAEEALGTTRQNLSDLARRYRAVRLRSSDGNYWWPTFQFRRSGGAIRFDPGTRRLWERLPHGTFDGWELASWMLSARHDLNGRRPIDLASSEAAVDGEPLRSVLSELHRRAHG